MKDIRNLNLNVRLETKKSAKLAQAVNAVGTINHEHAHKLIGGTNLLKHHKNYHLDIDV